MLKKGLAVAVILLFIGTCIIPSATSGLTIDKNIITVDDEPGDADFTSIKEAVNYSSPGDTIEVYSGTYLEQGIRIEKDDITLRGISHELGEGNDSGKPFIKGDGTAYVIKLIASYVNVSNFIIENPWSEVSYHYSCIRVGTDWPDELYNIMISDCIITDCIIRNSTSPGISVVHTEQKNITIINNNINYCRGIFVPGGGCIISDNVITDCSYYGIWFRGNLQNVSGNRIRQCRIGIQLGGDNNIVYGNDIENCDVGIQIQYGGKGNIITKNNFKNYSRIGIWFGRFFLGFENNKWIGNYWDTWIGVGPKIILGLFIISEEIRIPWFNFDWKPAQEPYDIGV